MDSKRVESPKDLVTPTVGLLANEWMGSVDPQTRFRAKVSGTIYRVNLDGSLVKPTLPERIIGDGKAIFFGKL